jgi:hypothetical protein
VGSEAPITKLSQSNFSIIATGRTNCVGMHATFNLKNRQDLVSVLLGMMMWFYFVLFCVFFFAESFRKA